MDTLTKSCSLTKVITANGEVQTLCDENGHSTNGSTVINHIIFKMVFEYSATRRTSFRSWFHRLVIEFFSSLLSSTSMTPWRKLIDRSSTLPTTTVLSDSESRAREDLSGIESNICVKFTCWTERTGRPLTKLTKNPKPKENEAHELERETRFDPTYQNKSKWDPDRTEQPVVYRLRSSTVKFWNTGEAARIQNDLVNDEGSWTRRLTRQFFSWTIFRVIPTSLKTEIERSVRGPKLQEPRAEDALVEPYLVQKILMTWQQQITRSSATIANLETIIGMQSWCRIYPLNGSSHIRANPKLLRKHRSL